MATWEKKHPCRCGKDPVFIRSRDNDGSERYRVQCLDCCIATMDFLTMTVAWMEWEDGHTEGQAPCLTR